MAAPILAGIGKMFTGVVAGTTRGLAMGARATATTAKSSGNLVQSASNVKSNIIKSNKKIKKIKLNRTRIKRSIFNEQKRKEREKRLESRGRSNKKGLLSSPLSAFGGVQKFITTLLFGMAISNVQNIMKFFDDIGEGLSNFGKVIQDWYDNTVFVLTLGTVDGQKLRSERTKADSEIDKLKFIIDSMNVDVILGFAHRFGKGFYMNPRTLDDFETKWEPKGFGAEGALGILDPHVWQAIVRTGQVNEAIENEKRKKELLGDKYEGPLNNVYTGPVVVRKNTWIGFQGALGLFDPHVWEFMSGGGNFYFGDKKIGDMKAYNEWLKSPEGIEYLRNIDNNRLENLLNSDSTSNDNTVIINKKVIEKKYIPVK